MDDEIVESYDLVDEVVNRILLGTETISVGLELEVSFMKMAV